MLDRETRKRIEDYFEGFELVELLDIPVEDILEAFEDLIEENIDEINETIGYRGIHDGQVGEHSERGD